MILVPMALNVVGGRTLGMVGGRPGAIEAGGGGLQSEPTIAVSMSFLFHACAEGVLDITAPLSHGQARSIEGGTVKSCCRMRMQEGRGRASQSHALLEKKFHRGREGHRRDVNVALNWLRGPLRPVLLLCFFFFPFFGLLRDSSLVCDCPANASPCNWLRNSSVATVRQPRSLR